VEAPSSADPGGLRGASSLRRLRRQQVAVTLERVHGADEATHEVLVGRIQLTEWLLPVFDLELEPGAAFTFTAPTQPGWNGIVSCRILEIEAPRKLSYTWVVGDMQLNTVVTFTLTPTASGTRLSLVQSGFEPDQKRNFGGARYGWKLMGGKLVDLLARMT
jgi:uncharacterized protein YndB with AHSA1/START domain